MTVQTITFTSAPIGIATAPGSSGPEPGAAKRIYFQPSVGNSHRMQVTNAAGALIKSIAPPASSTAVFDDLTVAANGGDLYPPWEFFVGGQSGESCQVTIWY